MIFSTRRLLSSEYQIRANSGPTFSKTLRTSSKSSRVRPADICVRTLAPLRATIGKMIAPAKTPYPARLRDNAFAVADSPHITGMIGVSDNPVSKPMDCNSARK